MYQVSTAYLNATTTSHQVRVQVTLLRAGKVVISDVPFLDGSITVDGSAFVRRTLALTLPPEISTGTFQSKRTRELVKTTGDELRIRRGIVFPDGSIEWVPLGVFRVESVPQSARLDEPVQVTGKDRCADLVDDEFLQLLTYSAGSTTSLIAKLIRETLPSASVVNLTTVRDARVPATQKDGSRADFIRSLAEGIGAVVYVNGFGDFVIANAAKLTDKVVYTLRTGVGGTIVSADTEDTRDGVFNRVVARGTNASGDFNPVQAVVTDDDPSSPTRFGDRLAGRYGKITMFVDSTTITSMAQAQQVAQAELAKRVGVSAAMDVSSVPLPFLEPGDSVMVIPDDAPAGASARKHIVDSYTLSLSAGGEFSMSTRDVREVSL